MNRWTKWRLVTWSSIKSAVTRWLRGHFWTLIGIAAIGLILLVIWSDLRYHWSANSWYTVYFTQAQRAERQKSIWDWLELLVVPVAIAVSALFFSSLERKNEQKIAEERAQDDALQAYFEQMSTLLIKEELRKSNEGDEVRVLARAWTLAILSRLKRERKGTLLRFLYEAGLIMKDNTIVSLVEADLMKASLYKINLSRANLSGAFLFEALLFDANLEGANLSGTYLSKADLTLANLKGANLSEALLPEADLALANLEEANLSGAFLSKAILERAKLSGAKYNIVTRWPDGFIPEKAGARFVHEKANNDAQVN